MQSFPSATTHSRLNHRRVRNVLAFLSVLTLSLLFAVNHATAAVHAKSTPHKAASLKAKSKAKSKAKTSIKKSKKKKPTKKVEPPSTTTPTSTTPTSTTPTSTTPTSTTPTSTTPTSTTPTSTTPTTTTPTTPSPTSNPGSASLGTIFFSGNAISSWWMNQSAVPTRVQLVPDPAGVPGMAQQFTTYNTDVAPLTPTVNPRSQLDTPELFQSGQQYWESFEVYVPQTLTLPTKGWISLESAVYGAPFGGTPPATISINDGAFRFQRNGVGTNPFQVAWTAPVVKGQWYRFTWHFDMAANGWIELYVNDVQQQLKSGSSSVLQLPIAMIDKSDATGPWYSQEQLYYQLGILPSASVYFKNYQVGATQAGAES